MASPTVPAVERHQVRGWDRTTRRDNATFSFDGRLLVAASTQVEKHVPELHDPDSFAPPRTRCSACRWTELRIFRTEDDDPTWVVESIGRSIVPGEEDRRWFRVINEAREVVASQVMTDKRTGEVRVPFFAERAFDKAADHDPELAVVVDNYIIHNDN